MKVIFLLMLAVGAAVCSIAGPGSWDDWRTDRYYARERAREARRDAFRATEHARRVAREARRQAFERKLEIRREERQFLREMRQHRLEVEREVRDAFRAR